QQPGDLREILRLRKRHPARVACAFFLLRRVLLCRPCRLICSTANNSPPTFADTRERTRALGIWASCYGIAIVIGPTAGGPLVDASGWRSIFLLIVPFCLVTLVLVMTVVPESSNPQGRRLDLPGQALAIASLSGLSLAAIEGPRWGWASTGSVAAFSLSV